MNLFPNEISFPALQLPFDSKMKFLCKVSITLFALYCDVRKADSSTKKPAPKSQKEGSLMGDNLSSDSGDHWEDNNGQFAAMAKDCRRSFINTLPIRKYRWINNPFHPSWTLHYAHYYSGITLELSDLIDLDGWLTRTWKNISKKVKICMHVNILFLNCTM